MESMNLESSPEFEWIKKYLPLPLAIKLRDIRNENNPTGIFFGILDLFEQFFLIMSLFLLANYQYEKTKKTDFPKNSKINTILKKRKWSIGDKCQLAFEILGLYKDQSDLLPIENLYLSFFHSSEKTKFVSETIKNLKTIIGFDTFLKDFKEIDTLENFNGLMVILRNKFTHENLIENKSLKEIIQILWNAVIKYFFSLDFFENYTLGYLSDKHITPQIRHTELAFYEFQGIGGPERYIYSTEDEELIEQLEIDQVYLGSFSPKEKPFPFVPKLHMHPLIIYRPCNCNKCNGDQTLFFAKSLQESGHCYQGAFCSGTLKPDDLKERLNDFFDILINPSLSKDVKTYKRLKMLREKYKALYRDLVMMALEDGVIEDSEKVLLEEKRNFLGIKPDEAYKIEMEVRNNPEIQKNIKNYLSETTKQKYKHFKEILKMAWIDGNLSGEENIEINKMRELMNIRHKDAERIKKEVQNEREIVQRKDQYLQEIKNAKNEIYKNLYELALLNGEISSQQLNFLQNKQKEMEISNKEVQRLEKEIQEELGLKTFKSHEGKSKLVDKLLQKSQEFMKKGDLDEAILNLKNILFYISTKALPYQLIGDSYMRKKEYPEAVKYLMKSFLLNANDFVTSYNLVISLYKTNKIDQAKIFAKNCISIAPKKTDAYIILAHLLFKYSNKDVEALDVLTEGLRKCENQYDVSKIFDYMIDICKENSDINLKERLERFQNIGYKDHIERALRETRTRTQKMDTRTQK